MKSFALVAYAYCLTSIKDIVKNLLPDFNRHSLIEICQDIISFQCPQSSVRNLHQPQQRSVKVDNTIYLVEVAEGLSGWPVYPVRDVQKRFKERKKHILTSII